MAKYRSIPKIVEAEQFFKIVTRPDGVCTCGSGEYHVHTPKGIIFLNTEDWILNHEDGSGFQVVNPDIFAQTHERVH